MLNFINSLFKVRNFGITQEDIISGAISNNVYKQKEVVAKISIPTFNGINRDGSIRKFLYQFQDGSSGCVSFTMAKITMILYWLLNNRIVKWSPGFWYTQRINKPNEGMNFFDIVNLAANGAITNELLPSEGLSESQMNDLKITDYLKDSADGFSVSKNWIQLPLDFETVASTIENTKKPIMAWFTFGPGEFFGTAYPKIISIFKPWTHSTTFTDTATINGIKYLVLEESSDKEEYFQKFISKEFFSRCILARYPINFKFNEIEALAPKYTFTKNLSLGMTDPDIKFLQDILKYEGLMANNLQSTNYFGNITKNALIAYQNKNSISPAEGFFGRLTREKMNAVYS